MHKALYSSLLAVLIAFQLTAGEGKHFEYPKDIRAFRVKALKADGVFAPDIAFAVRTCRRCSRPYVFGSFPRLKRTPWDSIAAVHEMVQSNVVLKAPPKTVWSARHGKQMARACPVCDEPENGARPDTVLFCHVIPETGEDMQIEYQVQDKRLVSKTYWRMPRVVKNAEGAAATPEAVKVELSDESEESIKKAYGHHFSLRAVWNGLFASQLQSDQIVYKEVSPGLRFILRGAKVDPAAFKEFGEKTLKADRDNGVFSRLETPLKIDQVPEPLATFRDWAARYENELSSGAGEIYVAVSYPELRKAAADVLATRDLKLEIKPLSKPNEGGSALIARGDYKTEIRFAPLALEAITNGISLHECCAYFMTNPAFAVEAAEKLALALQARRPLCGMEVRDGHLLVLKDGHSQERTVDVLALADKLNPDNALMFDLFVDLMLAWDPQKRGFGPLPNPRDVAPTGLPAFIERRIRPVGHLRDKNLPEALYEPREDADKNRYDLCYTSECSSSLVFVDPAKERFKGMTLDDAKKVYDSLGCLLPMYIEAQDSLNFPGETARKLGPCKVALVCGVDFASLGAEDARATCLADAAGITGELDSRIHVYAFTTNTVAVTTRKLTEDELKLVRSRMTDLVSESGVERGLHLDLHFDLPRVQPRGKVVRRR
ncbi:MAG TPA: hypothetical protein VEK08_19655 [Planctomycetota bacterium]|nr:hypothetical protein [Planctomycetota bacterium]